jgi:hypothetical protein
VTANSTDLRIKNAGLESRPDKKERALLLCNKKKSPYNTPEMNPAIIEMMLIHPTLTRHPEPVEGFFN